MKTSFFYDKFGVTFNGEIYPSGANDPQLHTIVYLQVAIISQALIFITRSHGFFFMERPSVALMVAFCIAQLVSSVIAAYGDWGFTEIRAISGDWIGIVWVWVCILVLFFYGVLIVSSEHCLVLSPRLDQVCHEGYHHQEDARTPRSQNCGSSG